MTQLGTVVYNEGLRVEASLKTSGKNVTTAGTAVSLVAATTPCREVLIQAKRTNTGVIFIGPSSVLNNYTNGVYLEKGDSVRFFCTDLLELYVNSTVNGEGVTYLYW